MYTLWPEVILLIINIVDSKYKNWAMNFVDETRETSLETLKCFSTFLRTVTIAVV